MKLKQLWQARNSIIKLINSDLPVNLAWRLKPLATQIQELAQAHADLVQKHGQRNGEAIEVPKEAEASFVAEFNLLLDEDLGIEIKPVHLDELNETRLSAVDLINLDWLIIEAEIKEPA